MKNYMLKITILTLITLSTISITLFSAIESEYKSVDISEESYRELTGGTIHQATSFLEYPSLDVDKNDGYKEITLPFEFGYRGKPITKLWISINGFITFDAPKNLPQNDPEGLFIDSKTTFQTNVVAPFWGDHVYREASDVIDGYTTSSIRTKHEAIGDTTGLECFVVEWKDLNINEHISNKPSSVASFQLRLYKSLHPTSLQGDIEFAYGLIGSGSDANIEGASIGIKGSTNFINGLHHAVKDPLTGDIINASWYALRTSENTKSSFWQPSGGSNYRIRFNTVPIIVELEFWGDGDTDLSQNESGRHFRQPQNRFVNFADVRDIMKNMSKNMPLDSVRGQAAYHADVNHDGRFALKDTNLWARNSAGQFIRIDGSVITTLDSLFDDPIDVPDMGLEFIKFNMYDEFGSLYPDNEVPTYRVDSVLKEEIKTRAYYWNDPDSIPKSVTDYENIYFYADEYDAAMIVEYLGAKIPALPWVWDTVIQYGKVSALNKIANDIQIGTVVNNKEGQIKLPLYLNGDFNGALSLKLSINSNISGIEIVENEDNTLLSSFDSKTVVLAGSVNYDSSLPIAFLYVNSNNNNLLVSDIYFNSNIMKNRSINIEGQNELNDEINSLSFNYDVDIKFNATEDGFYSLVIYDLMGNIIKSVNEFKTAGKNSFNWNATNDDNIKITNGMYVYSINGTETSVSGKLLFE